MAASSQPPTRGFYVFQTALGSPLQFHPALGTCELDALMDAYLPSPATVQDKRASISVDFFDHYRCTGESIKFYQVSDHLVNSTTSSPSSAQDSGYGSSFAASPLAPTWSWGPAFDATATSTPSTSSSASTPQITSRKQPSSKGQSTSSRANLADLSSLPGMKILTRDGRDVTNTATRGCKTKEQRDHAHLMRIMKACNSCRRKKVRCNPSHRALAGSASPVEQSPRSAMKAKIPDQACKPAASAPSFEPAIIVDSTSPPLPSDSFEFGSFDLLQDAPVDEQASWDEFLRFNGELDSVFPDSFGCLPDLSPPSQSIPGRTFVSNSVAPIDASMVNAQQPDIPVADIPMLPYVERNREPHNYVDFNLYSPSSTFSEAELAIVDDLPHTSIPRRTESTEKQRGDALFSERLATSTVYGPEVCLNTRWLDHKEGSRSSLLQTWLSTNSQSLPGLDSTTTRYIPTSPGDEAVSTTTVGFSDANTTNVQVAGDESPSSSPVLRVARFRDESVGFSQARAVNRQEPAVLASVSPPPQHFATTYDDVSTAANVGEQRFSMNAARHAVPGNENRGVHHTVESNVVQPTTAEPSADERTEHKHLQPKAAAPRPTASTSSAVGEPRSEEARTVVVANTSAVCEGSTPSGVISTSLQEARASVTSSVSVGVCLATSRNDRVDTGIDIPTTTQGWISPVTTSKSQQDLMSATVTVVAFALVAACVYSTSSNAMWTVSCAVLCTVSRMGQAIDYPASSARRLHARRGAARVATILNRIPVVA